MALIQFQQGQRKKKNSFTEWEAVFGVYLLHFVGLFKIVHTVHLQRKLECLIKAVTGDIKPRLSPFLKKSPHRPQSQCGQ